MSVLRTAFVNVLPQLDQFGPELTRRLRRVDASAEGSRVGGSFGTKFATTAREKIKSGLLTGLGAIGLGAGIGAAISGGVVGALDVGAANDKLRSQLNLTADESARLGKTAGELYSKNYGSSMGDVNDAISDVVRQIPSMRTAAAPVLKDITAGGLDISRVFGQDVNGVMAAVGTMLKSGVAPNAQEALDVLTKGFQSGADKGGDLLDTFTEYSVQFDKLGLDGSEALGLINQLLAGGARNADVAGDAIKEFSIRAIDGSKSTSEGYKLLGLDADKTAAAIAKGGPAAQEAFGTVVEKLNAMQDPVKRNTAGVDLFGTKWEDLGGAIRNLDVGTATTGLNNLGGATKTLTDQSDSGRIGEFGRSIQQAFVEIIGGKAIPAVKTFVSENQDKLGPALTTAASIGRDVLLPALKDIGGFITGTLIPGIGSVVDWFREHDTTAKALGITLGATLVVVKGYAAATAAASAATTVWAAITGTASAVQTAYNVVMGLGNSLLVTWIGVKAIELGTWVASTAATIANTAANVAYAVATGVVRVATIAWTGVQWLLNAALTANPIGIVVVAIGALVAAIVYAYYHSATFRAIVQATWSGIKVAISAVVDWFTNTAWPAIRTAWNAVGEGFTWLKNTALAAWNGLRAGIDTGWTFIRDKIFNPVKTFITQTIPGAFETGVNAIRTAWDKVQEAARKPVAFVVNQVVNPLIRGYNKIAGVFPGVGKLAEIGGFAAGGRIPGPPSVRDNRLAVGPGGLLKVASGEFITNTRSTMANLPLLHAINNARGPLDVDPVLDGYARGGLPRFAGDGIGDFFGKVFNGIKGASEFVTNPKAALTKLTDGALASLPGADSAIGRVVAGMARKVLGGIAGWLDSNAGGGAIGGGGIAGGYRGQQALISRVFPQLHMISAFRPGARTLTGHTSYHALGRAVDYPANRALAAWIRATYGANTLELITPWPELNLWHGRPHTYTGAVWNQHNFAGGNAHVHWAAALGGLIGARTGLPFGSYDAGGYLPPGLSVAHNGTGRPEPVGHPPAGNTYNLSVTVPVGAHPAEVGRQIVEHIKAFEAGSGARWRTA